jgi:hypothetical protein
MSRSTQQPCISDQAIVIPLDAPTDGAPSNIGFYLRQPGLPWLVEELAHDVKGAQALVAAMAAATAVGLDALCDDQIKRALYSIESQLHRCAAMADRVAWLMFAENRASKGVEPPTAVATQG